MVYGNVLDHPLNVKQTKTLISVMPVNVNTARKRTQEQPSPWLTVT